MKKIILSLLSICFLAISIQAQDSKSMVKSAEKALGEYIKDPSNAGKLDEAKTMFDEALSSGGTADLYNKKGAAFIKLADQQMTARLLNPEAPLLDPLAAVEAFGAYSKALSMAEKKGDRKKAINGISETETHLNNVAINMYQTQDYEGAFKNFDASINAKNLLAENDSKSRLDDPALMADQKLFAGITAYYSENTEAALPYYEDLYAMGTEEPAIYEGLIAMKKESDPEGSLAVLEAGREKFPDNTSLLFAEINHYLAAGELDALIGKLEYAIEKEPENLSVITTLGNVYDQLHVAANAEKDEEKSEEYFNKALDTYKKVLDRDDSNFDAWYSSGALYYNKAASMAPIINELGNDFSAEGTKKYDEMKEKMDNAFAQALPYFEKAESINSQDRNTLIALKEIFARQSKFDKVETYTKKLESINVEE